jgi:hypothetical protein
LDKVYIKNQNHKKKGTGMVNGKKKLCWGLKKCTNQLADVRGRSYCLTLWDRDLNAALNIRRSFLYRNSHNYELPEVFRKKSDEKRDSGNKRIAKDENKEMKRQKIDNMQGEDQSTKQLRSVCAVSLNG